MKDIPPDIRMRFPVYGFENKNTNLKICYEIAQRVQPKKVAEIGVKCGYSGWAFSKAVPNVEFYGFDNFCYGPIEVCECAHKFLLKDTICKIYDIDTGLEKSLSSYVSDIDLFHIDGDHEYVSAYHDLELAREVLSEDGVILVDDTTLIPEVTRACLDFIWVHDTWQIETLDDPYYGKMLLSKKGNRY